MNLPAAGGEVSVKTQISENSSCASRKKSKNCLPGFARSQSEAE